jgi:dUTP pyrophosphatase
VISIKRAGQHNFAIPSKGTEFSAGYDLTATEDMIIRPRESVLVPTGFSWELPKNYCGQIWPRSGLAVKHKIDVHAGLIDSDYRGEVKVLLFNNGGFAFDIFKGDRIAQMVIVPTSLSQSLELVDTLDETVRSDGGFGSTGK